MLRSIIPRDDEFFDLFDTLTAHIVDGVRVLHEMLVSGQDIEAFAQRLHECEHRGDETVHTALAHLHRTFVTPLDRNDIHHLVTRLDDILDLANAAGSRLALYKPRTWRQEAVALASTLVASGLRVRGRYNASRDPAALARSRMSSSRVTRWWMSLRSSGVTKVR